MKLKYIMSCYDETTGDLVATISSYSEEGLLEESGKGKWVNTIKAYLQEQNPESEEPSDEEKGRIEIEAHTH